MLILERTETFETSNLRPTLCIWSLRHKEIRSCLKYSSFWTFSGLQPRCHMIARAGPRDEGKALERFIICLHNGQ